MLEFDDYCALQSIRNKKDCDAVKAILRDAGAPDGELPDMARHIVAELAALREQLRWRLPDETGVWAPETLPEEGHAVDVTMIDGSGPFVKTYKKGEWLSYIGNSLCSWENHQIAAWRPRPRPYTPETKETR